MHTAANQVFYVYTYMRPDGEPFYVGKGLERRAKSMSPSRRTKHFMNVVRKYGRNNIKLELVKCDSEQDAFFFEKHKIKTYKQNGVKLINITDGGEGAAGRKISDKSRAAFSEWHGGYYKLNEEAKQNILDGLARGREKCRVWRESPEGVAHLASLSSGQYNRHPERVIECGECHRRHTTKSAIARFCSRRCEQRNRRARQKNNGQ